jgi:hypothetical protein
MDSSAGSAFTSVAAFAEKVPTNICLPQKVASEGLNEKVTTHEAA